MTGHDTGRHEHFMRQALVEARKALDRREFPVGCVIVYNDSVIVSGARENSAGQCNELDHAEIVALRNLYAVAPGIDLNRITVYSTMEPCLMCYATMLVSNVGGVVYGYEDVMGGGTGLSLPTLAPLYAERRIEVVGPVLRRECLELFRAFFRDGDNAYLRDSLLARYTLAQQ
jgi:tRNA(adenine34) deaminase